MSPADFQSVAQVIEAVAADEIYNLSGQSSVTLSFAQPAETLTGISLGTLNMLETGLTLRNTMSDVPVRAWGRNPRPPQSRPSAPNETAPSSFWQMISQDRANHDNPQRYFSAEITHM
jgi:GDP-mannose 4,6 dehydratase